MYSHNLSIFFLPKHMSVCSRYTLVAMLSLLHPTLQLSLCLTKLSFPNKDSELDCKYNNGIFKKRNKIKCLLHH